MEKDIKLLIERNEKYISNLCNFLLKAGFTQKTIDKIMIGK